MSFQAAPGVGGESWYKSTDEKKEMMIKRQGRSRQMKSGNGERRRSRKQIEGQKRIIFYLKLLFLVSLIFINELKYFQGEMG